MSNTPSKHSINIEDLFDWLEQQPELAPIRDLAANTPCEYRQKELTPELRLNTKTTRELPTEKGFLGKLLDEVWVPGRKLRGNAFSTPELDGSLTSVAKLMSISTLWDFVTTIPLFSKSLSLLAWGSLPVGAALSFILLLASNYAGHNSTDRRPRHAAKANWSLTAFVLLSVAKTLVAGVGVDLLIGNQAIATGYAQKLAHEKLEDDRANIKKQREPDPNLIAATQRCDQLQVQMQELGKNRAANDAQYISYLVQANGTFEDNKTDANLTSEELSKKYSLSKGVCRYKQALNSMMDEKMRPYIDTIERQEKALESLPPLEYLRQYKPEIFNEHFRIRDNGIEWVNGSEAVGEATDQFYRKLFVDHQIGLLGFSLFVFAIAVVLTGASSILLYLTGKNPQVQASFTGELEVYRKNILSDYEKLAKQEEL